MRSALRVFRAHDLREPVSDPAKILVFQSHVALYEALMTGILGRVLWVVLQLIRCWCSV